MNIARPDISIVMANRNGGRYVDAAIRSVLNQTTRSWELLVVDDASEDDSVAVVERHARDDARIRIFVQPTCRGPGAARNRGITAARGSWFAIFDSDDLMRPQRLETLLGRAGTDGAQIVADNLVVSSETGGQRSFLSPEFASAPRWISLAEFVDSNRLYARVPDLGYLKPMLSLPLLRKLGLAYDESLRIGEDYDFLARVLARGPRRLRLEPQGLYVYRRHASSTSHRIDGAQIAALIAANERFGRERLDAHERQALERRGRSLNAMLLYDRVIVAAKARNFRGAAKTAITAPQTWPLLTRPLRARLRRAARRFGGALHQTAPA